MCVCVYAMCVCVYVMCVCVYVWMLCVYACVDAMCVCVDAMCVCVCVWMLCAYACVDAMCVCVCGCYVCMCVWMLCVYCCVCVGCYMCVWCDLVVCVLCVCVLMYVYKSLHLDPIRALSFQTIYWKIWIEARYRTKHGDWRCILGGGQRHVHHSQLLWIEISTTWASNTWLGSVLCTITWWLHHHYVKFNAIISKTRRALWYPYDLETCIPWSVPMSCHLPYLCVFCSSVLCSFGPLLCLLSPSLPSKAHHHPKLSEVADRRTPEWHSDHAPIQTGCCEATTTGGAIRVLPGGSGQEAEGLVPIVWRSGRAGRVCVWVWGEGSSKVGPDMRAMSTAAGKFLRVKTLVNFIGFGQRLF